MQLSDVTKIEETTDKDYANALLKAGWKLLQSASMATESHEYSSPMIKYSLGWVSDEDPVFPRYPFDNIK